MPPEIAEQVDEIVTVCFDAEKMLQLASRDQQTRSGDEAGNDGMAEKVGEQAEAQHTHRKQHQTRHKCEQDGRVRVADGPSARNMTDG